MLIVMHIAVCVTDKLVTPPVKQKMVDYAPQLSCNFMFGALKENEPIPELSHFIQNISHSLKGSPTSPSPIKLQCGLICSCFHKKVGVVAWRSKRQFWMGCLLLGKCGQRTV